MRFPTLALIILLCTCASAPGLTAQNPYADQLRGQPANPWTNTYYVWAKSGLSVRDAGNTSGQKVGVLPYGTQVKSLGSPNGREVTVTAAPACECPELQFDPPRKSQPVTITAPYVEIEYQGHKRYVFAGYLSKFPPPAEGERADHWLERLYGERTSPEHTGEGPEIDLYPAGAFSKHFYGEGGGSTTYVLPYGSLNEGLLILDYLTDLFAEVSACGAEEERVYHDCLLHEYSAQNGHTFDGTLTYYSVRSVENVLIIHFEGSC